MTEIAFDNETFVGNLRAFDFFGDGSFYLVDTPGHTTGHLGGLVRTGTNPNSFLFMAGDLCHHHGEVRPSRQLPLPKPGDLEPILARIGMICPGTLVHELNTKRCRTADQPFFDPKLAEDIPKAVETIHHVQLADAREDVLLVFAHDTTVLEAVNLFPLSANNWRSKNVRSNVFWKFLGDYKCCIKQEE